MERNIVIPTCIQDRDLLIYQIRGFNRYLDTPVTINYVLNELHDQPYDHGLTRIQLLRDTIDENHPKDSIHKISITDWKDLNIYDQLPFRTKHNGWFSQQIIKLFFPLDHPYLVLDTKDILLRHSQWEDIFKHHDRYPTDRIQEFTSCLENISRTIPLKINMTSGVVTPQVFDPAVIETVKLIYGGLKPFLQWFDSLDAPSEFLVYDYVQQYINHPDVTKRSQYCNYAEIHRLHTESDIRKTINDFENDPRKLLIKLRREPFKKYIVGSDMQDWFNSRVGI